MQLYFLCLFTVFIFIAANIINSSVRLKDSNNGKPSLYWLHSLLLSILTGFGSGTLAPILIGKPPAPVSNDVIIPISIIVWYLVFYLGFDRILNLVPVRVGWNFALGISRTQSVCNGVRLAMDTLSSGPFYHIPLLGPIIIGTIAGKLIALILFTEIDL